MKRKLPALLLSAALSVQAEPITTVAIYVSAITNVECLRFELIGVCVWITCTPFGCDIDFSPKFGQYNPDLVVSAHNGLANNPWVEMNALYGPLELEGFEAILALVGGGFLESFLGGGWTTEGASPGFQTREHPRHDNVLFKGSHSIGHPAAGFFVCPSVAAPFEMYHLDGLDMISYRFYLPETFYPEAWTPGMREIGQWPINTWGAVYPRGGFVTSAEEPKAAAVVAQRCGDFITREGQPHVYRNLRSYGVEYLGGYRVWLPDPLYEGDCTTGMWQMLTPVMKMGCEVFGEPDLDRSWAEDKMASDGGYAFTLWRPYKCCEIAGEEFLFDIDFRVYPECGG